MARTAVVAVLLPLTIAIADEPPVVTLDEAMQRALMANEQIAIQQLDVSIAGREVNRAWAIISPRLDASARYERPEEELRRDDQIVVPEDSWRATITARQPVFDGRVLPARRAGLALESAEVQDLAHTVRTTLFDVTASYFEVLRALKQVDVAEQTVTLASEEVSRARARFEAGEARRTEVLRAEVDESRALRNQVAARNEYRLLKADLASALGWSADTLFHVAAPEPAVDPEEIAMSELFDRALTQRNDLCAAKFRASSDEAQRAVIRRESWPTLDLEYNHRFAEPESFSTRNNSWDIAAVARMDFWDGGNRRISRMQQEERIDQSYLRVQELEKLILVQVQQAWLDLQTLRETLLTLQKEVDLAEENYRTLSEQARVGLATSLDVSTALNALDLARTELARQQYDTEVAKHRMAAVTGVFAEEFIEVEE